MHQTPPRFSIPIYTQSLELSFSGGFRRGFRPPTTGSSCTLYTSYNILRPFLPSVNIDGGGGRLFFYFTIHMFERFTHHIITWLVFQYIPNLSNFLFQTYNLWSGPRSMHSMVFAWVWVYSSLISHSFRFAGTFLRRSRDLFHFFHDPHFLSVFQ